MRALTNRELEVVEALWTGAHKEDMAQSLNMSLRAFKSHISRIGIKMGIDHRRYQTSVRIVYLTAKQRGLTAI